MNCREFSQRVRDLAADRLMDALIRRSALAHSISCRACSALLAEERSVNEDLRLYAEATDQALASPRLKQSLRAAFDAWHSATAPAATAPAATASAATAPVAPVIDFPTAVPRRWARWTLAAAAGLIALLAVGVLLSARREGSVAPATPIARETPVVAPTPSLTTEGAQTGAQVANAPRRRAVRASRSSRAASTRVSEETTAFIPLTYLGGASPSDGGLIVRVEVPRTTLLSLGLPLNLDRREELIKADLLVGDDGIARAIRLVE